MLASFDPRQLEPARAEPDRWREFLPDCEPVDLPGAHGRWRLRSSIRRQTLRRLGSREAMRRALEPYRGLSDEPLQRAIERLLDGRAGDLGGLSREELAGLAMAREWFEGLIEAPGEDEIRSALPVAELLAPLRQLAGEGFVGRQRELARLADYVGVLEPRDLGSVARRAISQAVYSFQDRPPLMVHGPGGVGKSTLLARFILEHLEAGATGRLPFVYLDIDRPAVNLEQPLTILVEAMRQLSVQFPESGGALRRLVEEGEYATRRFDQTETTKFSLDRGYYVDGFAAWASAELPGRPILFVLDTFEEAQFLGDGVVSEIWSLLEALQRGLPRLRIVVSGRARPEDLPLELLELADLDEPERPGAAPRPARAGAGRRHGRGDPRHRRSQPAVGQGGRPVRPRPRDREAAEHRDAELRLPPPEDGEGPGAALRAGAGARPRPGRPQDRLSRPGRAAHHPAGHSRRPRRAVRHRAARRDHRGPVVRRAGPRGRPRRAGRTAGRPPSTGRPASHARRPLVAGAGRDGPRHPRARRRALPVADAAGSPGRGDLPSPAPRSAAGAPRGALARGRRALPARCAGGSCPRRPAVAVRPAGGHAEREAPRGGRPGDLGGADRPGRAAPPAGGEPGGGPRPAATSQEAHAGERPVPDRGRDAPPARSGRGGARGRRARVESAGRQGTGGWRSSCACSWPSSTRATAGSRRRWRAWSRRRGCSTRRPGRSSACACSSRASASAAASAARSTRSGGGSWSRRARSSTGRRAGRCGTARRSSARWSPSSARPTPTCCGRVSRRSASSWAASPSGSGGRPGRGLVGRAAPRGSGEADRPGAWARAGAPGERARAGGASRSASSARCPPTPRCRRRWRRSSEPRSRRRSAARRPDSRDQSARSGAEPAFQSSSTPWLGRLGRDGSSRAGVSKWAAMKRSSPKPWASR